MKIRLMWMWTGVLLAILARAESTIDPEHKNAYGANIGWINAEGDVNNGAVIGQAFCSGYMYSANCGWIKLGSGSPLNGWQYANNSATDWGVNHDGMGKLSGYAWGANVGWINFEQSYGKPCVDLRNGNLSGLIWGANVGWITLSNATAYVRTANLDAGPDTDYDGIADWFEWRNAGDLTTLQGGTHDADDDGTTDVKEALADTDPLSNTDTFKITSFQSFSYFDMLEWSTRPTRLYCVEMTENLASNDWTEVFGDLIGPPVGAYSSANINKSATGQRFYRVRAVIPLSE